MVLVNAATNEVTVRLVYCGPGSAGKTTNLRWIEKHLPVRTKGKLVELTTQGDRTLFFGCVPLAIGIAGERHTRLQLYTVPGEVHHEATWRQVLRGCDGVVFVGDSQASMLDANLESLRGLQQNLPLSELDPSLPQVIQYNKRDLPTALPTAVLEAHLNPRGLPHFEAIANAGTGVERTLKAIVALVSARLARESVGTSAPSPLHAADLLDTPAAVLDTSSEPERSLDTGPAPDGSRVRPGQWLVLQDGRERGPLSFDELVDLVLASGADEPRVWRHGLSGWVSASKVDAIAAEIPPPIPTSSPSMLGDEDMPDFDTLPRLLRTVLIADEDARFRRYLAMPLAAKGFTVHEAEDGSAAWQIAVQRRPWMILAEVSMPEVDGFELCRRVRAHPLLGRRPLLFVSGADKYRDRHRALQIGADDFLSKSMPIRELLIRIELLMARYTDIGAPREGGQAAPPSGMLEGRVEVFGTPSLVQLCHERRLTGELSITADEHGAGAIGFREGEIVSARVGALAGVEAIYALLRCEQGDFRFTPGDPASDVMLGSSVEQLLVEGCRRIEASRRGTAPS